MQRRVPSGHGTKSSILYLHSPTVRLKYIVRLSEHPLIQDSLSGSFRPRCNFGIARRGLRWRELSEHNETKIYLKYFRLTRRGLKFPDKPNMYCTKSIRIKNVIQNFEFMLCSIKIFRYMYNACNLILK